MNMTNVKQVKKCAKNSLSLVSAGTFGIQSRNSAKALLIDCVLLLSFLFAVLRRLKLGRGNVGEPSPGFTVTSKLGSPDDTANVVGGGDPVPMELLLFGGLALGFL